MEKIVIRFDKSHGNLIQFSDDPTTDQSLFDLIKILEETDEFQIKEPVDKAYYSMFLDDTQIFVLAAPTKPFSGDDINYILDFVNDGGGLLLLNNADAYWHQLYSLNALAARIGCKFGYYAASEPEVVTDFTPHFISNNLSRVIINESSRRMLSRLTMIEGTSNLTPIIGNDYSMLIASTTHGKGRVVIAATTSILSKESLSAERSENKQLVFNILKWLTRVNPFDFVEFTGYKEVSLYNQFAFEVALRNPTGQPFQLDKVQLSSSSSNDQIVPSDLQDVTLYPDDNGNETQKLRWKIEPSETLGDHTLRLNLQSQHGNFFYQRFAHFGVKVPGHSQLTIRKSGGQVGRDLLVGNTFELLATGEFAKLKEKEIGFTPQLTYPAQSLREESTSQPDKLRWCFIAREAGVHPIQLKIIETGQIVQTFIGIKESHSSQITDTTRRFINPLEDQIKRILPSLSFALTAPKLVDVAFKLVTIEEYIAIAFLFEPIIQRIWDVVDAAFFERQDNRMIVADILYNLAPTYIPRYGAFVPFTPDLVNHLVNINNFRRRELLANFLKDDQTTDIEIKRRVASYLSHEKYGHGFFYTATKLGQQLTILDKYHFLDKYAEHILSKPFPQQLYLEYQQVITILKHSTLIANEGFASWLEIKLLEQMDADVHAVIPERLSFMKEAKTLLDVKSNSRYFEDFPIAVDSDSPYEEGREYLEQIETLYPEAYGTKCAIQAFIVATSIPLGIEDGADGPQFAFTPDKLEEILLDKERGDARSDLRLWRISRVLEDTTAEVKKEQEMLQCHAVCLHPECPVRGQIFKRLGWRAIDD